MLTKISLSTTWEPINLFSNFKNNRNDRILIQQTAGIGVLPVGDDGVVIQRYESFQIPDDGSQYWGKTFYGDGEIIDNPTAIFAAGGSGIDLAAILASLDAVNGEVIGTTAEEKIDEIEATKLALETVIEVANVDVPANTLFSNYPDYITKISDNDNYIEPSFWPTIPAFAEEEYGMYVRIAIFPDTHNFISYMPRPNCLIDWGDGTSTNAINDVHSVHQYDYDAIVAPVNSRGYKIVIMHVHGDNGFYGREFKYNNRILSITMKTSVGGQAYFSSFSNFAMLESFEFVGINSYYTNAFGSCPSLRKLKMILSGRDRIGSMIYGILHSVYHDVEMGVIDFSTIGAGNGFYLVNTFASFCSKNKKTFNIKQPLIPFSAIQMFYNSLTTESIIFDSLSNCNNGTSMFQSCTNLTLLRVPGMPVSFNVNDCPLNAIALNAIFNDLADLTSLPAQTITITGCEGASTCDTTIATNKNWIVTN